jgi:hypothetical protein
MATSAVKRHRIQGGVRLLSNPSGSGFWVRCLCGWESGLCTTPVLANAAGEQHVQLSRSRGRRSRTA